MGLPGPCPPQLLHISQPGRHDPNGVKAQLTQNETPALPPLGALGGHSFLSSQFSVGDTDEGRERKSWPCSGLTTWLPTPQTPSPKAGEHATVPSPLRLLIPTEEGDSVRICIRRCTTYSTFLFLLPSASEANLLQYSEEACLPQLWHCLVNGCVRPLLAPSPKTGHRGYFRCFRLTKEVFTAFQHLQDCLGEPKDVAFLCQIGYAFVILMNTGRYNSLRKNVIFIVYFVTGFFLYIMFSNFTHMVAYY